MSPRVTMADVGRLAGVSHQTVSRVLNEPHRVNAETRDRVQDAIKSLRYHRSTVARALATNRTRSVGLISTGLALHSHSKRMIAFNEAARASGYQVSMASLPTAEREPMQAALDVLMGQGVEGIVLIVADKRALDIIDALDLDVPLVVADSGGSSDRHNVAIDQFLGARMATAHLIELGHSRIAHLSGPDWSLDASERLRGWRTELESAGLPVIEPLEGNWTPESGYERGLELAASGDVTAVFAANDQMALGLLHGLSDGGVGVPGGMSVVGFDDIPEAAHFIPPLTTVRQDFVQLGFQIMSTLLGLIDDTDVPEFVHTEPQLIVRKSTAAPSASVSGRPASAVSASGAERGNG
ncbi:LacI family DNA-binding transcriptional regulator [Compostimonas suwonensis]|uniref:DNA-binding LacI/PurR family transcriptional regulator n=1 Tax=Compostimonas suwonensis TaxID=1048394 RepID=A0A2M9BTU7_9MICO|nr:LacI family DNA-binding transcriptional regulator [Compostimonas suwonensis]PJJ61363.1 DNA-binding LacI/PurR family transcriptional regulator [Compostimonas suwonensis]